MNDTMLYTAAEAFISHELGVDTVHRSNSKLWFLYNGSCVEIIATYLQEKEPHYFDIRRSAASKPKKTSDVCIFSVKKGCQWDFYIIKTSIIDSCFEGQPNINLSLIEPMALHVKAEGIKQAVDVACNI